MHHDLIGSNNTFKDKVWFLGPKVRRMQVQRTQYNEFVDNRLEN